jgi:hypothetical protein
LLNKSDVLDIKVKNILLSAPQRALRDANVCVTKLRHDKENKWAKYAKVKHVQEGENNTNIFVLL